MKWFLFFKAFSNIVTWVRCFVFSVRFQSPKYSRAMANMVDESSDNIWARKFLTLETRVKQIELVSCSNVLFFRILFVEMYLTFNARKMLRLLSKFIEMFLLNS